MLADRMDALEARIVELREREELEASRPDRDGAAVMAHLGITPGREVGEALAMLLEARMEEGHPGAEEAYRRRDAGGGARTHACRTGEGWDNAPRRAPEG